MGTSFLRFLSVVRETFKHCILFWLNVGVQETGLFLGVSLSAVSLGSIVDELSKVEILESLDCGKQKGNVSGQGEYSSRYRPETRVSMCK